MLSLRARSAWQSQSSRRGFLAALGMTAIQIESHKMNYLLYFITAFIWGSTWLAIHFQLGDVSPLWSLAYRFAMATFLLWGYCLFTKRSLKFNPKQHNAIALQGLFMFSLNYTLYYFAAMYVNSGILAVVFATIIFMNIFNSRLFFKTPIDLPLFCSAVIGLLGLTQVFWSEFEKISFAGGNIKNFIIGVILAVIATYVASLGNMISAYILRTHHLSVIESNTLGMGYGTIYLTAFAILLGIEPHFNFSLIYTSSLIYLGLFGSVIAFGTYFSLLNQIGPERVAYVFVLTPVVALVLSTFFENFTWRLETFIGLFFVLLGNVLVLNKKYFSAKDTSSIASNLS